MADDIARGEPLAISLYRRGLATKSTQALIASSEKANNLPWALRELGDAHCRRAARGLHYLAMVVFPLAILGCAAIVGIVCIAIFKPLTEILDHLADHL